MSSKILLIENDQDLINVLQKRITDQGYECQVSRNGREALIKMREARPDLVLAEITVPGMSGFEILGKMSQDKNLKDVPVIFLSNAGLEYEFKEAEKLGAKELIIKTEFDPGLIIDKIKEHINK